jgi:hypothetical protein
MKVTIQATRKLVAAAREKILSIFGTGYVLSKEERIKFHDAAVTSALQREIPLLAIFFIVGIFNLCVKDVEYVYPNYWRLFYRLNYLCLLFSAVFLPVGPGSFFKKWGTSLGVPSYIYSFWFAFLALMLSFAALEFRKGTLCEFLHDRPCLRGDPAFQLLQDFCSLMRSARGFDFILLKTHSRFILSPYPWLGAIGVVVSQMLYRSFHASFMNNKKLEEANKSCSSSTSTF